MVAVYSSFLQRAYDQIVHDVCLQKLHVIFAIDRAGLVGSDGETHQGIFDLSYLSSIPNLCIMAPKHKWELSDMMKFALAYDGPIAIRYPRGEAYDGLEDFRSPVVYGRAEVLYDEEEIALLAVGSMIPVAVEVRERLRKLGYSCSLINARFVKPIDQKLLAQVIKKHRMLVTMEENVRSGGFGDRVLEYINDTGSNIRTINVTLPDDYIEHGNVDVLKREICVDADSVLERIIAEYAEMLREDAGICSE